MDKTAIEKAEEFYFRVLRGFRSFTLVKDIDCVFEAGRLAGFTVEGIEQDIEGDIEIEGDPNNAPLHPTSLEILRRTVRQRLKDERREQRKAARAKATSGVVES